MPACSPACRAARLGSPPCSLSRAGSCRQRSRPSRRGPGPAARAAGPSGLLIPALRRGGASAAPSEAPAPRRVPHQHRTRTASGTAPTPSGTGTAPAPLLLRHRSRSSAAPALAPLPTLSGTAPALLPTLSGSGTASAPAPAAAPLPPRARCGPAAPGAPPRLFPGTRRGGGRKEEGGRATCSAAGECRGKHRGGLGPPPRPPLPQPRRPGSAWPGTVAAFGTVRAESARGGDSCSWRYGEGGFSSIPNAAGIYTCLFPGGGDPCACFGPKRGLGSPGQPFAHYRLLQHAPFGRHPGMGPSVKDLGRTLLSPVQKFPGGLAGGLTPRVPLLRLESCCWLAGSTAFSLHCIFLWLSVSAASLQHACCSDEFPGVWRTCP